MPGEIERIKIQTHPTVTRALHMTKEITDHVAAQFSMPYAITAAVHRVALAEWQNPDKIKDSNILKFMEKVFIEGHPKFFEVQAIEPGSNMTMVEVAVKGRTFKEEGRFPRGFSHRESVKMTDEDLIKKFRANVSKGLPQNKMEKAVTVIMGLEKSENISEMVEQVRL
jgi:2-methylcitrate dehydratase PrpD